MIEAGKVAFKRTEGRRLDTGDPAGYLEAVLYNAARDPALKPALDAFVASYTTTYTAAYAANGTEGECRR
jgi:UTP-glucose-1-phosphate uridylyltransferase